MTEKQIYEQALETWGPSAQTNMMFEEMTELQKELCKNGRGKDNRDHIAEEIADVLIMLEQMMILHDCKELVSAYKAVKLQRLEGRIKEARGDLKWLEASEAIS